MTMTTKLVIALSLLAATAHAQPNPPTPAKPAPTTPAPTTPTTTPPAPTPPAPTPAPDSWGQPAAPATPPTTPATPPVDPNTPATPPVDPNAPVTPPPAPTPPPSPTPPPAPVPATPPPPPPAKVERKDDYYQRKGGAYGIFHGSRLSLGVAMGDAPQFMTDMNGTEVSTGDAGATMAVLAFEGAYLELPSSYGNFHGIEFSAGLRSTPIDFWLSFGTAVTFFNIGRGQPGSFRLGGSFGAGFNLAHGFGYIRARAALVIIPTKVDAEMSVQWTPSSASTQNYDERTTRISVWYRYGKSRKAVEGYIERYQRLDEFQVNKREFDGYGVGVGWSLF